MYTYAPSNFNFTLSLCLHPLSGHCGCAKGQFETVKILNSRGANLWLRNARGDLPVHEAATSGRMELVEWLLQQKPSHMNSSSNDGRTILHIAAGNDKIDMCKMLIEMGADANAVYRNTKNVVKTPLDCALQKGFRSTAKYIQMHGGLPANKLRLSGRKTTHANILPELDEVKPLKFTEIEVSYEHKERRRGSETDTESENARGRHKHRKHHRKCSHKRRTSSCSEMFICHRADEPCEINRSKSSTELSRRRKHHHQHSISTGSSESESSQSDSEDECCYHIKRKHRCYKKVKSKSGEGDSSNGSSGNNKKGRKSSDNKKRSESSERGENDKDQSRGARKDKKRVEIASSAKKSDNKSASSKGKNESKATTKAAAANKKRPPSGKSIGALQKKGSQEEKNRSIDKPPKTPEPADEPSMMEINSKKSTTTEEASEDDKSAKEITTQAEVHEAMQQHTDVDEGALTDATYTIEKRDKSEIATFEPETIKEEASQVNQESSKKVSFKSDANNEESAPAAVADEAETAVAEEMKAATPEPPEQAPQPVEESPIDESTTTGTECEKERAFAQLPSEFDDSDEFPENIARPKSQTPESIGSFTILEDGDDAEQKLKEFEEMTQDDSFQQHMGQDDDDSGEQYYDDSSSAEKMPRRLKDDSGGFKVLDDGKDQDSGIEPSPRALRSKIPGPRSSHSSAAVSVTRRSFLVTEDRPRSTRIEGRKPGDKNACNMTTVTQSIQKNIRR
jgi:hypothetical protein